MQVPSNLKIGESAAGDILKRDLALDGIRGVAIGMVLLVHGFIPAQSNLLTKFIITIFDAMTLGVDLFFVLSGFLITTILIRTRDSQGYFKNFYVRRALRIFPAYYLVMLWVFVGRPLVDVPPWQADLNQVAPYYLTYTQNLIVAWRGEGLGWVGVWHTWSLAIEEQFYLLWPALIFLTPKKHLLRMCLLFYVGLTVAKIATYVADVPWIAFHMGTLSHSEGLAAGAALGAWFATNPKPAPQQWMRIIGILSGIGILLELAIVLIRTPAYMLIHLILVILAVPFFTWILCEVVTAKRRTMLKRVLETAPLTFLGRYSYGIYLIHAVVLFDLRAAYLRDWQGTMGGNWAIVFSGAVGIAATIILAMAMYHIIEHPILRLKRYFVSKPAVSGAVVSGEHLDRAI